MAFLDQPGIWHEEPLRDEYLETHTAIGWQRPFDARWIGRFFIDSDGYDFPFYFLSEKQKLWGRCIRGWFEYPVWFDGDRTMVHFEKKFPPKGMMLVYFLDTYGQGGLPLSPVAVMQKSLGEPEADRLLDFDGTQEQVLLEHRNAVCAMTAKIEAYFAKEASAPAREEIKQYADDVSTFIRLIRERVFEYDRFAAEMEKWLKAETAGRPAVAADLEPCEEILAEIREVAAELPKTSLGEVRDWTEELKTLSGGDKEKNLALAKKLPRSAAAVAGTQDDLARNLSVATIRLYGRGRMDGRAFAGPRPGGAENDRRLPRHPPQADLVGAMPQVPAQEQSGRAVRRRAGRAGSSANGPPGESERSARPRVGPEGSVRCWRRADFFMAFSESSSPPNRMETRWNKPCDQDALR